MHFAQKLYQETEPFSLRTYRKGFSYGVHHNTGKPWPEAIVIPKIERRCASWNQGYEDGARMVVGRELDPNNNFYSIIMCWYQGHINLPFTPFPGCEHTLEFENAGGWETCDYMYGMDDDHHRILGDKKPLSEQPWRNE